MKVKLEPFGQRVLLRRVNTEKTRGGIYIPETKQARSTIGRVLATGPDCVWVTPGEYASFSVHGGFEVPVEGWEGVILLNEEDLLARAIVNEAELVEV